MSKELFLELAGGGQVQIDSIGPEIAFQLRDTSGQPTGAAKILDNSVDPGHGGVAIDGDSVVAVALSGGGFEAFYLETADFGAGRQQQELRGEFVDPTGHVPNTFPFFPAVALSLEPIAVGPSGNSFAAPQLHALFGDRILVDYTTDAGGPGGAEEHLAFMNAATGVYATATIASRPDTITDASGDITLTWHESGQTLREVFAGDGTVLAARGVSHDFSAGTASASVIAGFDEAHDQLTVLNPDGSIAGGTHSTLTFNVASHTLTWDQDSEGPAAPTTVAVLPGVDNLTVANLAEAFRPEVLKVVAADGSSTISWFDSDRSQTWDSLAATLNAAGQTLTYAATMDDGTKTGFTFDADNSQLYQRIADQYDDAGEVVQRTVVYDDGEFWTATFTYESHHVDHYELDSFNAAGVLVSKGFFNADGSAFNPFDI